MTNETELASLTEAQRELLRVVQESSKCTLEQICEPHWDGARRFASWEYYVAEVAEELWDDLSMDAKLIAVLEATDRQSSDNLPFD